MARTAMATIVHAKMSISFLKMSAGKLLIKKCVFLCFLIFFSFFCGVLPPCMKEEIFAEDVHFLSQNVCRKTAHDIFMCFLVCDIFHSFVVVFQKHETGKFLGRSRLIALFQCCFFGGLQNPGKNKSQKIKR